VPKWPGVVSPYSAIASFTEGPLTRRDMPRKVVFSDPTLCLQSCSLATFIRTFQHLSVLASNLLSLVHCSLMALQACPYVERPGTHIVLEATDVSLRSRGLIERYSCHHS
jgi:hypothetical protein